MEYWQKADRSAIEMDGLVNIMSINRITDANFDAIWQYTVDPFTQHAKPE